MSALFVKLAALFAALAFASVLRAAVPLPLPASDASRKPFAHSWALGIAAALTALLTALSLASFELPHGDWDAWSIWNLHARFLGQSAWWQHAVSPLGFRSHPDYPLLLPSLVSLLGHANLLALGFAAAGAAALFFAVLSLRGTASALLALIVWTVSTGYLTQVPSQYADIPLSVLLLVAVAGLLTGDVYLCGFAAGAAAFTKNEGIVFALAMVALAGLAVERSRVLRLLAAAAPGLALTLWFKLAYAPPSEYSGQSLAKLADPSRWAAILGRIPGEMVNLGMGIGHPLVILSILALGLGFSTPLSRVWKAAAAVIGVQLLGYLGAYLLTPNDLAWQLDTSMSRLAAQVWPSILLLFFAALRPPELLLQQLNAQSGGDTKAERRKKKAHA